MKGSTMDAMSDAIEGADVMLYSVSLAYKAVSYTHLRAHETCADLVCRLLLDSHVL